MKILVTGAGGFIGKNLTAELRNRGYDEVCEYDIDSGWEALFAYCSECDFVFHLAGVNRPKDPSEFMTGNCGFLGAVLELLKKREKPVPVLMTSSIQAALSNPYGESKLAAEKLLWAYAKETGARARIYRLPNVFGKWCRPNYNSVVATFCHNIANSLPIQINGEEKEISLIYIDDVVRLFLSELSRAEEEGGIADPKGSYDREKEEGEGSDQTENEGSKGAWSTEGEKEIFGEVRKELVHTITLGELAARIRSFRESRENKILPDLSDGLTKKLYSTYLSYLPKDSFSYPLSMHKDDRGSFTEFIKAEGSGQVSVNVIRPGVIKGNHWHHTKNEKFLVVSGRGCFQFRKLGESEVFEYHTDGKDLSVIDVPCGYVHNIINEGSEDMVVVIWANEIYDPNAPDTFYEKV